MDAVEFIKQLRRMEKNAGRKRRIFLDSPEDVVAEVEEWAKMNPIKTRQSVFLEQYPNAPLDGGALVLCPRAVDFTYTCPIKEKACKVCRKQFWSQEVE